MAKIIPLKEFKEASDQVRFSTIKEYYRFIPQANGKSLNAQDREVFDTLKDFTKNNNLAKLDYSWLQEKFGKCQKTIRLILKKLSPLFECKFVRFAKNRGVAEFCKIHIKRTNNFDQLIDDAILSLASYKEKISEDFTSRYGKKVSVSAEESVLTCGKEFPHLRKEVSASYKSTKDINKDISCVKTCAREEEEPMETKLTDEVFLVCGKQEYSSTEKKHEHISDAYESLKEQEYSNKEYVDDSEEEQAEIDALETGEKEVESERRLPKYALAKDCELELNYELSKAFDLETYSRTIKQITFSYDKTNHKLTLIHEGPLTLSANQKECLKTISAKVYGEGVAISSRARVKNEKLGTQSQNSIINDSGIAMWERVKKAVLLAKGEAYVRSWLGPLAAKLDEENKKLFISGPIFFLSFIQRELEPVLEAVMKSEGYTCDLLGYERGEEKLVASVPFVKFFPKEGAGASDISVSLKRW